MKTTCLACVQLALNYTSHKITANTTIERACAALNMTSHLAGEIPICDISGGQCAISEPAKHANLFCTTDASSSNNCQRYQEFQALYSRGSTQHNRDVSSAQERANSVVFNLFIFLQVPMLCILHATRCPCVFSETGLLLARQALQ